MSQSLLIIPLLIGVLAGGQLAPASALAQDDDVAGLDRTPRDCVVLRSVRDTEVIDDRTILFHLRSNAVLRNHLPSTCPQLEREDRFSYRVRSGRLCDSDTITVLPRGIGIGATCRLGKFYPMSPEELEELREGPGFEAVPEETPEED